MWRLLFSFVACALSKCGRRRALSLYVPGLACGRRRVGVCALYSVSQIQAWHAAGGVLSHLSSQKKALVRW
jgi:hypothetical protein